MDTRAAVLEILKEIKPTKDLANVSDIVEGGYVDSFELMNLIMLLNEKFDIEISLDDMTPENFNTVDAISAMVERLRA